MWAWVMVAFAGEPRPLVVLPEGQTVMLYPPRSASAVAVTDERVALPFTLGRPDPLRIQGVGPGNTDMIVQLSEAVLEIDLSVPRDLRPLERVVERLLGAPLEGTTPELPRVEVVPRQELRLVQGQAVAVDVPDWFAGAGAPLEARPVDPALVSVEHRGEALVLTGLTVGSTDLVVQTRGAPHAAMLVRVVVAR